MILLQAGPGSDPRVYDLDTELAFPCSLELYARHALRSDRGLRPAYHRWGAWPACLGARLTCLGAWLTFSAPQDVSCHPC